MICDAQVHAPAGPHFPGAGGMSADSLLHAMDDTGVDRCVIVPTEHPGSDLEANNEPALRMARQHPDRFAVMGRFDLARADGTARLQEWLGADGMYGIRLGFVRQPAIALLKSGRLDWFWATAEANRIPLMVLAPGLLAHIEAAAAEFATLPIAIDHLGLSAHRTYADLDAAVEPTIRMACLGNVSVKATGLPSVVAEEYPFPSLHRPVHRVISSFGASRVFWGSDLSRMRCGYDECLSLFSRELELGEADRRQLLGEGVCAWLGWQRAQ